MSRFLQAHCLEAVMKSGSKKAERVLTLQRTCRVSFERKVYPRGPLHRHHQIHHNAQDLNSVSFHLVLHSSLGHLQCLQRFLPALLEVSVR